MILLINKLTQMFQFRIQYVLFLVLLIASVKKCFINLNITLKRGALKLGILINDTVP